jgi:hypothetical protein
MNKREAKFIMQLPDGYEWQFINSRYIAGYSGRNILLYEIVGDELIQCEVNFEPIRITENK